VRLKVENLGDTWATENVMAPFGPFLKAEIQQQPPQVIKADVCVRSASEDAQERVPVHSALARFHGVPSDGQIVLDLAKELAVKLRVAGYVRPSQRAISVESTG
jgi:hypothetical protein